ncbi:PREDICTED: circularly permutated Ras protein 1 isoform X3 [Amphimedon queenslandica]|uniref:VWFA domain-containing protein n=1 Tax=Amphimedon queenslandica TaxID=400682 RepID=A0AAN0J8B0_AMPQE|nr:PREDICTED: circularly permutated Ras protein 1 isoform X1 [Amphimedon queenslandica]XP_019853247.1 PREDICTED: circularly permutated Ras protein 1 isoform X2 [Amphimedon queenslandica]XP_019853249.1 PREDICTED: circularly permutated Ras protein 1 isoform X3 [Amphimedon queenslandica]|eukprot:XP_019853243.1 PREDICTED: circularly permutated Ras protein 1 isoform X1 [Amphimedon queenslandica]
MEWGSAYVYHGSSEDEMLSETELEEGMYLSLSDNSDDDDVSSPPLAVIPPAPQPQFRRNLTAKPPRLAPTLDDGSGEDTDDETEDDDDEEEGEQMIPRQSAYADLTFPNQQGQQQQQEEQSERGGENEGEYSSGKYVQIREMEQEIRDQAAKEPMRIAPQSTSATIPPPPPPPEPTPKASSYSVPAPPPIKQLHGIMKKEELKKQKRQRVRWDKSYRGRRNNASQGFKTRRADTNVLAVKFNTLQEAGHIHTGDAQFCSNPNCGAVVSHLTKLIGEEDAEKRVWNCEYCGTATELDIVNEEIPTEEDTTYLITPASIMAAEGGAPIAMDESLVVFCIDTSGSMCVTTKVSGQYDIRGAKEKRDKMMNSFPAEVLAELRQPEYRHMQARQQNVTYISRMESLQAAVDTHLSKLVHSEPNKRVSIVTFSDDVTIMGDGRMVPVTIAGDKLSNSKAVIDSGKEIPLPSTIRETQKALSKKIYSLEESGQTALGPAALASVVIASQKPGSRVVLCTDGLANVGLGSLDVAGGGKAYASAENFYEDLGDIAMDKGVTVNFLSIKGTDCRVAELGQVATRTGGEVTIVDPLTVTEEFGSILSNPVIATDVVTKIIVHNGMYFRTEDSKENVVVKQVGNVTADSELTFDYGVRKAQTTPPTESPKDGGDDGNSKESSDGGAATGASASSDTVPPQMIDGQPHLPFQLQIEYTNSDGDRCLRVITKAKPITTDRLKAEQEMDAGIIGTHVAKQAADLTMQGEFTQARVKSLATQRLLQKHSKSSASRRWEYTNWCSNMIPLERELHRMQVSERSSGRNLSDDEDEFYERGSELMGTSYAAPSKRNYTTPAFTSSAPAPQQAPKMRKSKEAHRRRDISDDLALGVYGLKKASSSAFKAAPPRSASHQVKPPSVPKPLPPRAVTIAVVPQSQKDDETKEKEKPSEKNED